MSDMGFTPNLTASDDVKTFRFVVVSGVFTGAQAAQGTDIPVGVSDGSAYRYDQTLHAINNLPISLQPTNTVQITCGGNVSAGNYLMPDSDGRAVVLATAGNYATYIALEAGTVGAIIRAFRTGTNKQA
jgi:hypothetical protein